MSEVYKATTFRHWSQSRIFAERIDCQEQDSYVTISSFSFANVMSRRSSRLTQYKQKSSALQFELTVNVNTTAQFLSIKIASRRNERISQQKERISESMLNSIMISQTDLFKQRSCRNRSDVLSAMNQAWNWQNSTRNSKDNVRSDLETERKRSHSIRDNRADLSTLSWYFRMHDVFDLNTHLLLINHSISSHTRYLALDWAMSTASERWLIWLKNHLSIDRIHLSSANMILYESHTDEKSALKSTFVWCLFTMLILF
jgi:hypothetical protein